MSVGKHFLIVAFVLCATPFGFAKGKFSVHLGAAQGYLRFDIKDSTGNTASVLSTSGLIGRLGFEYLMGRDSSVFLDGYYATYVLTQPPEYTLEPKNVTHMGGEFGTRIGSRLFENVISVSYDSQTMFTLSGTDISMVGVTPIFANMGLNLIGKMNGGGVIRIGFQGGYLVNQVTVLGASIQSGVRLGSKISVDFNSRGGMGFGLWGGINQTQLQLSNYGQSATSLSIGAKLKF